MREPTLYSLAADVVVLQEQLKGIVRFLGTSNATAAEWNGDDTTPAPDAVTRLVEAAQDLLDVLDSVDHDEYTQSNYDAAEDELRSALAAVKEARDGQ